MSFSKIYLLWQNKAGHQVCILFKTDERHENQIEDAVRKAKVKRPYNLIFLL